MAFNLYKALRALLPGPRLIVGTVTISQTDRVTAILPDGSVTTARGSASVGNKVYIRDGAIEGIAPSLPTVEIEI